MGEVESWRSVTPNPTLDASLDGSPGQDHHHSPSQIVPASSPHNSFGGNLSSLSSRNSSLSRTQSKASLRSLFSRGRSASVASQRPDSSTSRGRPATASGKHSRHSSCTVARAESPHLSQIGSRLDSYRPTQVTHAAHVERARSKQQRTHRHALSSWDPPPLFQAYPQALKHAVLDASCLPTDVILRKSPYREGHIPDNLARADSVDTQRMGALLKRAKENKHTRKLSASISSSGWTRHLFVLVESGHLLQYAGGGHHDRLPEKMMQLGKDTVAFASDAIPGRHWVLQVSQAAGKDAIAVPEPSKGILSRIGVQSSESRRMTQNFLMVFDNAEDLDSWLTTIRREVEALGGRQYCPETPTDVEAGNLPSHRHIQAGSVQNDSYQFPGSKFTPHHHLLSPTESEVLQSRGNQVDDQMLEFRFWDHETASQQISDDSSTITSTDLDRLRDSKDSSGSTNTGTSTSLHGPSPSSSPGCDVFALRPFPSFESINASVLLDNQTGGAQVQDSTSVESHSPTFLCHALDAIDMDIDIQKDIHAGPSNARKLPNTTPNFSVPISSNRFSFFGSLETLNIGASRGTTARNSPVPENDPNDDDSAGDDSFSRRPVSIIAPLPTPEALMNPAGTRTRTLRRPSVEKPLPLQSLPGHQHSMLSIASDEYNSLSKNTLTTTHITFSSVEHAEPILARPSPSKKELPALPRSRSSQELSTLYDSNNASTRRTLPTSPSRGRIHQRPLSLSGFPEPPSAIQPIAPSPTNTEAPDPLTHVKPFVFSGMTTSPSINITGAPRRVNSRLSRIRDSRGLPKLGVVPPSGPPPSCPLPDTPSPRNRRFQPLLKSKSCSERIRVNPLPRSRISFNQVGVKEN